MIWVQLQIALQLVRQGASSEPPAAEVNEVKAEEVQESKETLVVEETQSKAESGEDSSHKLAPETSTAVDASQQGQDGADSKVF